MLTDIHEVLIDLFMLFIFKNGNDWILYKIDLNGHLNGICGIKLFLILYKLDIHRICEYNENTTNKCMYIFEKKIGMSVFWRGKKFPNNCKSGHYGKIFHMYIVYVDCFLFSLYNSE